MIKRLIIGLFTIASLVMMPVAVGASNFTDTVIDQLTGNELSDKTEKKPENMIANVSKLIASLVAIASFVMILIGGFQYVKAGADENGVKEAKNTIKFAVIGLILSSIAGLLINFVLDLLK